MEQDFYAMLSRMKYIERWALMRNSQSENIAEHSLEVSMIAHALAVINNKRLGGNINEERAALIAMYHDSTEIITGDMPTPIKYFNKTIQSAFKEVEKLAATQLLSMLPDDFKDSYESLFFKKDEDIYLWKIVKAADKLSALIKCIQEENTGNTEFASAKKSITEALIDMHMEEVNIFMEEFLLSYYKTLDELN